jgi:D-inositol-3-phosphate glycosyltransferase
MLLSLGPVLKRSGQTYSAADVQLTRRSSCSPAIFFRRVNSLHGLRIALLTGGGDKPYALGLAAALTSAGIAIDFVGSDDLEVDEILTNPLINFLNLRGDQRSDVSFFKKSTRILVYYFRLIRYAATATPKAFHILWNNKFEFIDRVVLMLYYRLLGKKVLFTAHNVNIAKRDSRDSRSNRFSLQIQYRLADHIFVHTEEMKRELLADFDIREGKVSVIPFGINSTVPVTAISNAEARQQLGVDPGDRALLFFGNIAPYKGLEFLIQALVILLREDQRYRLVIAGRAKGGDGYWDQIQRRIASDGLQEHVIQRIEYVPDSETEVYFKGADVLILPYTTIFQSGVLFLGYNFGLPVIASDVGSLRKDIIEGKTGFVCRPRDAVDLARSISTFFSSELCQNSEMQREEIRRFASDAYSWGKVAQIVTGVYRNLLQLS